MIISHKYKYLFIGLPFSASSAISKELYLEHEGEPYLSKHSLYYEFEKKATNQEKKYFVFAVLRNPMDIAVTIYEKMKANAKGNFTNPKLFIENGGHITKQQRERFKYIHNHKASFQQYFKKFFIRPYDNLFSLTLSHCDFIIKYENIDKDYLMALQKVGVEEPRPLPVANKTIGKKKNLSLYYTDDIKHQAIAVFGPFLEKYNYDFPSQWGRIKTPLIHVIHFKALSLLRKINQKYFKKHTEKVGLEGSIYGDMQRNKLKRPN
ncbi:MAG: hypothetical protein CMD16_03620 [Flavobacteriales bacterium]|nr:hypothetical protein [Flavobacteriales bacterium]|tara:strand:+ start:40011 stop:40802 length:792 start_codon:yes stop_codon:yes gene_type:complete